MSNKIPTAEEFLKSKGITGDRGELRKDQLIWLLVEFAKLHRKAILEAVVDKTELDLNGCCEEEEFDCSAQIDKKSILNAYPENLIQ